MFGLFQEKQVNRYEIVAEVSSSDNKTLLSEEDLNKNNTLGADNVPPKPVHVTSPTGDVFKDAGTMTDAECTKNFDDWCLTFNVNQNDYSSLKCNSEYFQLKLKLPSGKEMNWNDFELSYNGRSVIVKLPDDLDAKKAIRFERRRQRFSKMLYQARNNKCKDEVTVPCNMERNANGNLERVDARKAEMGFPKFESFLQAVAEKLELLKDDKITSKPKETSDFYERAKRTVQIPRVPTDNSKTKSHPAHVNGTLSQRKPRNPCKVVIRRKVSPRKDLSRGVNKNCCLCDLHEKRHEVVKTNGR